MIQFLQMIMSRAMTSWSLHLLCYIHDFTGWFYTTAYSSNFQEAESGFSDYGLLDASDATARIQHGGMKTIQILKESLTSIN